MTLTDQLDAGRFREPFLALYRDLDAAIEAISPICVLSGRCCRFQEYGHTLFLSEPEALLLLTDAPAPSRPLDGGETCPWQDQAGRCTARQARPLGCRLYFCDPAYETAGRTLSETFIGRLKALVGTLDLPWNYRPLHRHLEAAKAESRYPGESRPAVAETTSALNAPSRVPEPTPDTRPS